MGFREADPGDRLGDAVSGRSGHGPGVPPGQAAIRPRVLIVDDQPEIRKLVRLTLGSGHDVREARNGVEAIELARDFRPEVVLLDLMMPGGVDGFEVCRTIRALPELASTRVVFLTARGQESDMQAARRAGAEAFMVKPFSPLALIALVERLGAEREAARERQPTTGRIHAP